ncbi:hypothetical protein HY633_02915 [Candidatus Uhrbacteria bacterium]|nr:hypothetical protein [Candidatus Uhrbacteria bacterium]
MLFTGRKGPIKAVALSVALLAAAGIVAIVTPAQAADVNEGVGGYALQAFGWIIQALVFFAGQLLLSMIDILITVAKYNDFVNSGAVANGWIIVRDLTNMFFILVLLVLAFGTMLGVEGYSYKNRMLVKLLTMAVVINFSRTICGLFIDLSQVIMLTFVNGFQNAAGGNFTQAMQIDKLLQGDPDTPRSVDKTSVAISLTLALIMVVISLVVVVVTTIVLLLRIVFLWLLVVLSPLAFLMKAVPGGKAGGYYSTWWDEFTKNLMTGPVLAFFLWLSLVTVATGDVSKGFGTPGGPSVGNTEAGTPQNIQTYLIGIGMLMGGLYFAQKIGGVGAGVAGKAMGGIQAVGTWAAKKFSGYRYVSERARGVLDQKESERKEGVKESVAAWRGRVGLVESGIGKLNVPKTLAEGRRDNQLQIAAQQRNESKRLATEAAKTSDPTRKKDLEDQSAAAQSQAAAAEKKAKRAEGMATAAKWAGRAAGGLGLITEAAEQAGKKDLAAAADFRYKEDMRNKDTFKPKSNGEIDDMAEGRKTVDPSQQRAAILEAVDRKTAGAAQSIDKFRQTLDKLNADAKTISTFERAVERNFPEKANLTEQEKKRRMDAGQYNFKEAPNEQVRDQAQSISESKARDGYEKDINSDPAKRDAYVEGLVTSQAKLFEERARASTADEIKKVESSMRDVSSAILRSADKSEAALKSFGIQGGGFTGPNASRNQETFKEAVKQKGADDLVLKMPAGEIEGAVADAMVKGLSKNALTEAAKGAKTKDQEASIDKIVQKIRATGGADPESKAIYDFVQSSPVFNNGQQPRAPRVRPAGPAAGGGTPPPTPPAAPPTPPPPAPPPGGAPTP